MKRKELAKKILESGLGDCLGVRRMVGEHGKSAYNTQTTGLLLVSAAES